ncbi:MAG: hypothetical protein AAGG68_24365 [Bacteroidota bacterium]
MVKVAKLKASAADLDMDIYHYATSMVTKGYALAQSLDANEMHHISIHATPDQTVTAQLDSSLNQMILAIGVLENTAEELNHFTILELLKKRLGKDVSGCSTFSEWLFKEAQKRKNRIN